MRFEVEEIVSKILHQYSEIKSPQEMYEDGLKINEIYDYIIYPEKEVYVAENADLDYIGKNKVLGKYIRGEKVILLDQDISNRYEPRRPWVFAHEIGHAYSDSTENQYFIEGLVSEEQCEVFANRFAKLILMPAGLVELRFKNTYGNQLRYIGPGSYGFNGRLRTIYSFTHFCNEAASQIRMYFSHVSKQALGIRLIELGLIENKTPEKYQNTFLNNKNDLTKVSNILSTAFSV